ncbi:polyphosphate glucokinase [Pseudoclavibacter endophyticus]|uniref:ROK family protein n=1 Tax=Pseudoclavibacter endophyticus TaxID=1778590 RepID=A0A6H9WQM3_9MICO|nr:ROK family protein [Pseudoclavibacter endophyticus]KAB1650001.1 ROK family protein [Pseudoclavibacter endophyticus]GGA58060.1 polyphosphate glucokinase [Pseudoclavibacter endophyticus]
MAKTPAHRSEHLAIGIDVGGTGIKGGAVDVRTGELVTARHKETTPKGGSPVDIVAAVQQVRASILSELDMKARHLRVGVCLPSVVRHGVTSTAANISPDWIGLDAAALFADELGGTVSIMNDADAAGYAEVVYGAAKGRTDTVIVTTLGTGIGSALVHNGQLFPNTELGHLELDGHADYERYASAKVREREDLGFEDWAARLVPYYRKLEQLFSPDLFVVSGGVSKRADEFLHFVDVTTPLVAAKLRNNAGIAGAARLASDGWE